VVDTEPRLMVSLTALGRFARNGLSRPLLYFSCAALFASACESTTGADLGSAGSGGATFDSGGAGPTGGVGTGGVSASGGTQATSGGASGDGGTPPATGGAPPSSEPSPRVRASFNEGWRFTASDPAGAPDLGYAQTKAWMLPLGNTFRKEPADHAIPPSENLGEGIPYLQAEFDDSAWQAVRLPHDWAIAGPYTNSVSSSMGRLPSPGVGWYRKTFTVAAADAGKSLFLDLDGAMQYSLVWVNGEIVGGWPYGYASYRLDITDHVAPGNENLVVIRVYTPTPASASWDAGSSRWYPGAGIYRNVWLTATAPEHVAHWGTQVTTPEVTPASATVNVRIAVDNDADQPRTVDVVVELHEADAAGQPLGAAVATLGPAPLVLPAAGGTTTVLEGSLPSPRLWGVPPTGQPHLYVARTRVLAGGELRDVYDTTFGVRTIAFDGDGFRLNGATVDMHGVCLHHDLGALGAAFNQRARERQLEIMQEMGANAIRTAHNPFEPELYDLADRMGLLVMDEAFDVWSSGKAELDHHVFFDEWHEADLRALIRRDRNHPSVVMWSIGNEIVEQADDIQGPAMAAELTAIAHEEDPTRPTVAGMNKAEPESPFSGPIDTIGLNYQGTGVRDLGAQYPTYHEAFPDKFIVGTETTSTFSTRGTYLFPVTSSRGTPATGSSGIDTQAGIVSSYDLYHADWSYSPDEEFESQDKWPYVGGEFVWTGFDYLGEPTPLDAVARSSYFGIVDLAGFKKDRYFLYQARWRADWPMVHVLPHWTWPGREGEVTPVHVYTSGDSAEVFLNGVSRGRLTKQPYEYRLRWDDMLYEPGEILVVAYKDDAEWARTSVATAGTPSALSVSTDRAVIAADAADLAFVSVEIVDAEGRLVPMANDAVTFSLSGPGEIVATDSGDPTDLVVFSSPTRAAQSGRVLAIVRGLAGQPGEIVLTASASGLAAGQVAILAE